MSDASSSTVFFAYAGKPALRAETIRDAIKALNKRGINATSWEDLGIEGNFIINSITSAIDASDAVVAEVSNMNSNVLFEAGYAVAKGKHLWLALDDTDRTATKAWSGNPLISTVGRVDYGGNSDLLASKIQNIAFNTTNDPILSSLIVDAKSRESNAVFAPSVPLRFQAAKSLERSLERKSHLKILGSGDDLGLAPLKFYASEIYRSSASIFHLMAPHRQRAEEHNARASFLAGYAHGWGIPIIMVAEEGFISPLDYQDMLFTYATSFELNNRVDAWLENLPKVPGSNKRLGRLAMDVEMPVRSFGQYVAENEKAELNDYYIETNEFEAILSGRANVYVGRKGTGKTATMIQSVEELRKDRRNLVVPIKPSSYDLSNLLELLEKLSTGKQNNYLLMQLWSYLICTEIAIRATSHAKSLPAGTGGSDALARLEELLDGMGVDAESDFSTRFDLVVDELLSYHSGFPDGGVPVADLSDSLRIKWMTSLQGGIREVLHGFDRVAVVIDNLDKTWEAGVNYELVSQFLLALLTTGGKLQHNFHKSSKGSPSINLTLAIFLRTDIYDVMTTFAREPDKINPQSVQWQDQELLVRVLEDRYAVNRDRKRSGQPDMWAEVFCKEVRGMSCRDYVLWRVLPRPRDIIYFGNAGITTAINRRHGIVEESDLVFAENEYSKFAVEALLVESQAQGFDLEEALYEFAGLDSTISASLIDEMLSPHGDAVDLRSWLIKSSFLGVEISDGDFVHIEGDTATRRKLIAAERLASRLGRPMRFRVHPAFRPHLDIRDDDLHAPEITDVTFTDATS